MGVVAMNYYLLKEEVVLRQSIRLLPRHDDNKRKGRHSESSIFVYLLHFGRKKEKNAFSKKESFLISISPNNLCTKNYKKSENRFQSPKKTTMLKRWCLMQDRQRWLCTFQTRPGEEKTAQSFQIGETSPYTCVKFSNKSYFTQSACLYFRQIWQEKMMYNCIYCIYGTVWYILYMKRLCCKVFFTITLFGTERTSLFPNKKLKRHKPLLRVYYVFIYSKYLYYMPFL